MAQGSGISQIRRAAYIRCGVVTRLTTTLASRTDRYSKDMYQESESYLVQMSANQMLGRAQEMTGIGIVDDAAV